MKKKPKKSKHLMKSLETSKTVYCGKGLWKNKFLGVE